MMKPYLSALGALIMLPFAPSGNTQSFFDANDLPLYPGAQEIETGHDEYPVIRLVTYQIQVTPGTLLSWYKDVLTDKGWRIEEEGPHWLLLYYRNGRGKTAFGLGVVITLLEDDRLSVLLRVTKHLPL
jgi:hypothetical protein